MNVVIPRYFSLFAVPYPYQKLGSHDCLNDDTDLHSLNSDGTMNNENCMEWCNGNLSCRSFIVKQNRCHFKNEDCTTDNQHNEHDDSILFLKQGRYIFICKIFVVDKRRPNRFLNMLMSNKLIFCY